MLQRGWPESQLAQLLGTGASGTRPRRATRAQDISGGEKLGIILASVLLPLVGFVWGVVYLFSPQGAKARWGAWAVAIAVAAGIGQGVFLVPMVSGASGGLGHVFANQEEVQATCRANLKALATGVWLYSVDYDGRMPDATRLREQLRPYIPDDSVFQCPAGGTYAMNPALSNRTTNEIFQMGNPAEIVLLYEVDDRGRPLRDVHTGGAYYAYADGHVGWGEKP
ncbi:MAG: hypothetical protein ACP5KN_02145 [Armatimonadota bacterium]